MINALLFTLVILALGASARAYAVLPRSNSYLVKRKRPTTDKCSLAVFLGSGGHTSESLALLSTLDFSRYTPRTYVVSEGDSFSARKAEEFEISKAASHISSDKHGDYRILTIPRARRVHQPMYTTPPTALASLITSLYYIAYLPLRSSQSFSEVLILNGPGTCFVLCVAAYVSRFFGIPSPKLIYIESFARVKTLSLSGKLLRRIVDRFVVQWPDALIDGGRGECRGWLV